MGRWTQYDEDDYRLPEGMQRIGYDADTRCYTFSDEHGRLYESAPGNRYGVLTPVEYKVTRIPRRPRVTTTERPPTPPPKPWLEKPPKTFDDILPSGYISSAHSSNDRPSRLFTSVKKSVRSAMRKIVGIVKRRTRRVVKRLDSFRAVDEKRGLLTPRASTKERSSEKATRRPTVRETMAEGRRDASRRPRRRRAESRGSMPQPPRRYPRPPHSYCIRTRTR